MKRLLILLLLISNIAAAQNLQIGIRAGYVIQGFQTTNGRITPVDKNTIMGGIFMSQKLSPKVDIRLALLFMEDVNYNELIGPNTMAQRFSFRSVPVSLTYAVLPKLDLVFGAQLNLFPRSENTDIGLFGGVKYNITRDLSAEVRYHRNIVAANFHRIYAFEFVLNYAWFSF